MTENIKEKIEDKIIDLITLGASGRLVVFKPEKLNKDLIVEKRSDYEKKVISLNVYNGGKDMAGEVNQLALRENLEAEENFYLLFVHFDIVKQDVDDNFLVIPSLEMGKLIGESSPDIFSKFLVNKKDFFRYLIEKLEEK